MISVQAFGSHVSGLGMPQSDIDVVVVGLAEPDPECGFYETHQRANIARLLDAVTPKLRVGWEALWQ